MIVCKNEKVNLWINEVKSLLNPKEVLWIDGSESQLEDIRKLAVETGEMIKLNEEKLPGCYYYRTDKKDTARDEKRTVICTDNEHDAGPTNNWVKRSEMYERMTPLFRNSMEDRTMYIIPFSMGKVGSPFSKIGIEVTDSIYVVLSMNIMTRVGDDVIEELNKGADFTKCLHSKGTLDSENKWIAQFPEDNTIWSINSAYGGNVLLGKKCFALRIGSYLGKKEGWLAEHMLILCIEYPNGEKKYVCGAFPSACGKTNLAMIIPPKHFRDLGYKAYTIGDDISWLRIGSDGRLYAINPENGFFGVAPGTNSKSNRNALEMTKKNTIFTNVCRNLDDNTVWWEGLEKDVKAPTNGEDWLGNPWNGETSTEKGAHPNSRFTVPAVNCETLAPEFLTGEAVPISAIIFGGRRAKAEPLITESLSWNHGVFLGAKMSSETTAAIIGNVGVVRHDPMAMLPFCGYNMAEYFNHWIEMGRKMKNPPKIFNVNWFRQDNDGKFIWPGFGDNFRAILWALDRSDNKGGFNSTPLGNVPRKEDLDLTDLDIEDEKIDEILSVDKEVWKDEVVDLKEWMSKFDNLPKELQNEIDKLEKELNN